MVGAEPRSTEAYSPHRQSRTAWPSGSSRSSGGVRSSGLADGRGCGSSGVGMRVRGMAGLAGGRHRQLEDCNSENSEVVLSELGAVTRLGRAADAATAVDAEMGGQYLRRCGGEVDDVWGEEIGGDRGDEHGRPWA